VGRHRDSSQFPAIVSVMPVRIGNVPDLGRRRRGDLDEAVAHMAEVLPDYAHDWHDQLLNAANHRENRGLP
jgi:hypothetical protein